MDIAHDVGYNDDFYYDGVRCLGKQFTTDNPDEIIPRLTKFKEQTLKYFRR